MKAFKRIIKDLEDIEDIEDSKAKKDRINKAYLSALNDLEKVDDGHRSLERVQSYYLKALVNMNRIIINDAIENLERELMVNSNDKICLGQLYAELTKMFLAKNDINGYKIHLILAEKTLISEKNFESLIKLYSYLSIKFIRDGKRDEGISILKKTLGIMKENGDSWVAEHYLKVGSIFSIELNDNELALKLYDSGYKLAKKYNLKSTKILLMYYIAVGYAYINKRRDAIVLFNKILNNHKSDLSLMLITLIYMELATLYIDLNLKNIDILISKVDKNIQKLNSKVKEQFEANLILIKCRYYIKIKDKPTYLLDELNKAELIYKKYKDVFQFSNFDLYIEMLYGDIYYHLSEYNLALDHYENLIKLSQKYGYRFIDRAYEKISKTYEKLGSFKYAFEYLEKSNSVMISYNNSSFKNKYSELYKELEVLHETEREKSEFFANISHEFKTPINIIYSSIQLLNLYKDKSEEEFNDYYSKYKKNIKQNCLRSFKLIDNIIDVTKINKGNYEANFINLNIVELVEKIANSVMPYLEMKNIIIIFDTDVEELIIKCDAYMIERIILNILSNAIKFTPNNGKIFVNVHELEDEVEIRIKDTGIGIPSEMKERIFEKFTQVDKSLNRSTEGSGIGLSLVKSLLDLLNGRIYLNTKYKNGSEFVITLKKEKIIQQENLDNIEEKYELNVEKIYVELSDIYDLYC